MTQIYHLASATRWEQWPTDQAYLPAEYTNDGFIHCTAGDQLMIQVANRFYRNVPGNFVLLVIEAEKLTAELRWEKPDDDLAPLFPHIYGAIDRAAIVEVRAVQRDQSGGFLGWGEGY